VTDAELSRMLLVVADELQAMLFPGVGAIRQAARRIIELSPGDEVGCASCGATVEQPATGRRRKFCLRCSPRKTPENASLSA
jgi:hypothetical protein